MTMVIVEKLADRVVDPGNSGLWAKHVSTLLLNKRLLSIAIIISKFVLREE